jgi:hypothetical protein
MVSLPCKHPIEQEKESVSFQSAQRRSRTKKNFTMIRNEILDDVNLTHGGKLTLITLISYCWFEKETCFPGQERLAVRLHRSTRTIRRYLTELREQGYIRVCRRGQGRPNHYTIALPYRTDLTALEGTAVSCPDRTSMSAESDEANQIQPESDEAFSKAQKGSDEVRDPFHPRAGATTSKREGETQKRPLRRGSTTQDENTHFQKSRSTSNKNTSTSFSTHPTTPTHAERSNSEPSPARERPGRRRLLASGMSSIAEVMRSGTALPRPERRPEPARLTAPPLTQEDMDKRRRERLARERAQNPLPGIINDSDWQKLEQDHSTQTGTSKRKPMPVYEKLQLAIERTSEELGDFQHVTSNITQAENIRKEAHIDSEQFLVMLFDARSATRHAHTMGRITKQDSSGQLVKMPYFYAVLRQKAGITKKQGII